MTEAGRGTPRRRRQAVTAQQVRRMGRVVAASGVLLVVLSGLLLSVALHWLPQSLVSADPAAAARQSTPSEVLVALGLAFVVGLANLGIGVWHIGPGARRRQALLDAAAPPD